MEINSTKKINNLGIEFFSLILVFGIKVVIKLFEVISILIKDVLLEGLKEVFTSDLLGL